MISAAPYSTENAGRATYVLFQYHMTTVSRNLAPLCPARCSEVECLWPGENKRLRRESNIRCCRCDGASLLLLPVFVQKQLRCMYAKIYLFLPHRPFYALNPPTYRTKCAQICTIEDPSLLAPLLGRSVLRHKLLLLLALKAVLSFAWRRATSGSNLMDGDG